MLKTELEERVAELEAENDALRAGGPMIINSVFHGNSGETTQAVIELAKAIQYSAKALRSAPLLTIDSAKNRSEDNETVVHEE